MSESRWFRDQIGSTASAYGLDPHIVEAMVRVESSGLAHAYRYEPGFWDRYLKANPAYERLNPRRVSASYGLMQVMYPVARELGFRGEPEMLFLPGVSLEYGCKKLKELLVWAGGRRDQALAAYNGGKGGNGTPPYRNSTYVHKVLTALEAVRKETA
jgi:soluble lytic murein transglycosylase-like protein